MKPYVVSYGQLYYVVPGCVDILVTDLNIIFVVIILVFIYYCLYYRKYKVQKNMISSYCFPLRDIADNRLMYASLFYMPHSRSYIKLTTFRIRYATNFEFRQINYKRISIQLAAISVIQRSLLDIVFCQNTQDAGAMNNVLQINLVA